MRLTWSAATWICLQTGEKLGVVALLHFCLETLGRNWGVPSLLFLRCCCSPPLLAEFPLRSRLLLLLSVGSKSTTGLFCVGECAVREAGAQMRSCETLHQIWLGGWHWCWWWWKNLVPYVGESIGAGLVEEPLVRMWLTSHQLVGAGMEAGSCVTRSLLALLTHFGLQTFIGSMLNLNLIGYQRVIMKSMNR